MIPSKKVLIILILFVWVSVLLSLFGVVDLDYSEIIAYTLLFLGTTVFYPSFNKNDKLGIFLGSTIFLIGITFFITNYFEINDTSQILIPSTLLIVAISFLLIFLADTHNKKFLYIGLLICAVGIFTVFDRGNPEIGSYFISIKNLIGKFWIVALLVIVTVFILSKESKKDQQR